MSPHSMYHYLPLCKVGLSRVLRLFPHWNPSFLRAGTWSCSRLASPVPSIEPGTEQVLSKYLVNEWMKKQMKRAWLW